MGNKAVPVFLYVFMITALLCGCMGQAKIPGIQFGSTVYNFGLIEEGKTIDHAFEFTNNGTETLIIKEVHSTCGCTVTGDYEKEIPPGGKGKIPVTFKTVGYDGPVAKVIMVKTNAPEHPDVTLSLEGTIKVSVTLSPRNIVFGKIERDRTTPLSGKIILSNRLPDPIRITDVVRITDAIEIPNITIARDNVETTLETLQDGFTYSLGVTVKPPFKHGEVMGTILVKTDSELLPEIHTQFSYSMEPMVKVFPNPLFVGKDAIAGGAEQQINIVCEPGPDMRIADLSVNIKTVKVSLKEVEKGRRYTVVLNFPKDFTFDPGNTLMIKFKAQNVPDEPVFGIPVLGI